MKLTKELLILRWFLALGIVELTWLANILPTGKLIAAGTWMLFLLLVIVYLFDVTYHNTKRIANLSRLLRSKRN